MNKIFGSKLNTRTRRLLYVGTFILVLSGLAMNIYSAYRIALLKPGETITTPATGTVTKSERRLVHASRVHDTNEIVLEYSDGSHEKISAPDIKITNGRNGDAGKDGQRGDKGEKGERGEKGENGAPGKNGTDGKDGLAGISGKDGANGLNGADGAPGRDGAKGDKGDPGRDGTIVRCQNRDAVKADLLASDNGGKTWKKLTTLTGQCG